MKVCELCGSTYSDRVEFCFRDGNQLVEAPEEPGAAEEAGEAPEPPAARTLRPDEPPEPEALLQAASTAAPPEPPPPAEPEERPPSPPPPAPGLAAAAAPGAAPAHRTIVPLDANEPNTPGLLGGEDDGVSIEQDDLGFGPPLPEDDFDTFFAEPEPDLPARRDRLPFILVGLAVLLLLAIVPLLLRDGGGEGGEVASAPPAPEPPPRVEMPPPAPEIAPRPPPPDGAAEQPGHGEEAAVADADAGPGEGAAAAPEERESDPSAVPARNAERAAPRRSPPRRSGSRRDPSSPRRPASPPETPSPVADAAPSTEELWGRTESEPALLGVRVTSTPPGATIVVDGDPRGRAPVSLELPRGSHRFEARLDGHEPATREVEVLTDRLEIPFQLEAIKVPVLVSGPENGQVYVDGRPVGLVGVQMDLPPGSHTFRIVLGEMSWQRTEEVKPSPDGRRQVILVTDGE